MSIPGLGQDEPEEDITQSQIGQVKLIELKKEQEWRFEVALARAVEVKVSSPHHYYTVLRQERGC